MEKTFDNTDDIIFEEVEKAEITGEVDAQVLVRFLRIARINGIEINDLLEQAMIRECDYREGAKRYNIKDLMKDNKKKDKFRNDVNSALNKAGIMTPEWD